MPASVAAAVLDSVGLLSPAPAAPAPVPPVLSWPVAVSALVEGTVTAGAAGWAQTAAPHARALLAYNGGDLGVDSLVTSSAAVPQFVTDLTVWAALAATDAGVDLTLLATPAADVHATVGMLPQKSVGMRRDWMSAGLATLSPNWRYGPVLVDRKATRIPVAADVHGTWSWHRRDDAGNWATDTIVNANQTAIIPDDRVAVQFGWISLQLAPDPQFPGIPVQVSCINKPQPSNPKQRIKGLGGTNGDGSPWWMTLDAAIAMVESGRFFFYVLDKDAATPNPIVVDVSAAGNKFLRTVFDDTTSNNLLSLPQCPGQS